MVQKKSTVFVTCLRLNFAQNFSKIKFRNEFLTFWFMERYFVFMYGKLLIIKISYIFLYEIVWNCKARFFSYMELVWKLKEVLVIPGKSDF